MSSAVQDLLHTLDLEPLEVNLFRGRSPQSNWQPGSACSAGR
jgi:acyl-CoA thioesterase-2